jgi:hypothetical protein
MNNKKTKIYEVGFKSVCFEVYYDVYYDYWFFWQLLVLTSFQQNIV